MLSKQQTIEAKARTSIYISVGKMPESDPGTAALKLARSEAFDAVMFTIGQNRPVLMRGVARTATICFENPEK